MRSIQSLVANAVEGLNSNHVAVVDNNGNVLSKQRSEDDIMAGEGIVEYRQKMERYFSDKVESMLERVVGAGNAVVRVATEIDASRVSMMQKILGDDGSVLREQKIREQVTTSMDREDAAGAAETMMLRSERLGRYVSDWRKMQNVSSVTRLTAL